MLGTERRGKTRWGRERTRHDDGEEKVKRYYICFCIGGMQTKSYIFFTSINKKSLLVEQGRKKIGVRGAAIDRVH